MEAPHAHAGYDPDGKYNSRPRPRPRFDLQFTSPAKTVLATLREALEADPEFHGLVLDDGGKIELMLSDERVHFWSPQLSGLVSVTPTGTQIKARFGPHPHIWGLYLAGYAMGIILTFGLLILGAVQVVLDLTPWGLYATPGALLITALTYGASYVGQGLGAGQMHDLRAFLDRALEKTA